VSGKRKGSLVLIHGEGSSRWAVVASTRLYITANKHRIVSILCNLVHMILLEMYVDITRYWQIGYDKTKGTDGLNPLVLQEDAFIGNQEGSEDKNGQNIGQNNVCW
jgi:hypothetical protein